MAACTALILFRYRVRISRTSNRYGMSIVILVVGGIKGGAGKSTVSANLAARRAADEYQVLLVDGDDQQTTTLWAATRREQHLEPDGLTCIQLRGKAARTEVQRLAPNYRDVIVDVGGRDTTTQRAALTIADVVLRPIPPRGPDVWTLDQVASLLDEVRTVNPELRALAFLNRADPQGKDNADAETIIRETAGIELIEPRFGDRKAFPSAHVQGLAVFEAKPRDVKASAELDQLYRYLFDIK
jgi:chromosome partitioning protein